MIKESTLKNINTASKVIGKTWPLYSFVTSNPLSGYENLHFVKATESAEYLLGGSLLPEVNQFRQAWEQGVIHKKDLTSLLAEHEMHESPEHYLEKMNAMKKVVTPNINAELDRMMVKWLMAFMDEGLAEWEMPFN